MGSQNYSVRFSFSFKFGKLSEGEIAKALTCTKKSKLLKDSGIVVAVVAVAVAIAVVVVLTVVRRHRANGLLITVM